MTKPIERTRQFEKSFKKRIAGDAKLLGRFRERYDLFRAGERGHPLNDHALTGAKRGMRAFSVTADVRVIYSETDALIVFADIGTHSQVYR